MEKQEPNSFRKIHNSYDWMKQRVILSLIIGNEFLFHLNADRNILINQL